MANTKSSDQKQAPIAEVLAHTLCRISGYAYESAIYYARADQIIAELAAAGYVIVPLEPTEAMKDAGQRAACLTMPRALRGLVYSGLEEYRAMIEARPR